MSPVSQVFTRTNNSAINDACVSNIVLSFQCFSKSLSPQRSDCGGIPLEVPTSPLINIKDEPIDEDYDAALLPQSSSRQVKEELENQEVRLSFRPSMV